MTSTQPPPVSLLTASLCHPPALCAVFDAMRKLVDPESRNRIRKAAVVPLTIVASSLNEFGRTDATTAILTALNKLPKKWRMEIEKEANDEAGEVDYVLNEDLAQLDEECDEHAEITIAHELLLDFESFAEIDADNQKVSKLSTLSAALKTELADWKLFRTSTLNRLRVGGKVVEVTHEHSVQTVLRFFGYLVTICQMRDPTFKKVFCKQDIGLTVERYAQWLESQELAWSSITNYLSALVAAAQFATIEMESPPPLDQLANLRRQVLLAPPVTCTPLPSCLAPLRRRRRSWRAKLISTRRSPRRGSIGRTQTVATLESLQSLSICDPRVLPCRAGSAHSRGLREGVQRSAAPHEGLDSQGLRDHSPAFCHASR